MPIGQPDLVNKSIENRDKSKITKHLLFHICFSSKGDNLQFFTKLINSKLISALVSVISQFSCVLMQHKFDKFC